MDNTGGFNFKENISKALADKQLRANMLFATDTLIGKRKAVFTDAEDTLALRKTGNAIKARVLSRLPELLSKLEKKCTENGIKVHWAETTEEANRVVLGLMEEKGAHKLVKGKSMVSEEMHLNRYLSEREKLPLETDLGEFIIQLNDEPPSHIIVPAVHKNKREIAEIFAEHLPDFEYTDDVEILLATARKTLREHFLTADMGLSGVNFAVAETGTLCLVENEGNGRMCTAVPPVHVALMGLEKVVDKLADVPPLYRLLCGSATGQRITTYFNMINGPRKPGEKDGPKEVHLIILDNGRSAILRDKELRHTLQCIRCGTCLNHCPVYTRIGGHAYGSTYPGPIGEILMPHLEGLAEKGALATASSLCNRCGAVCPVMIPIPELIRRMRNESYDMDGKGVIRGKGFKRNLAETFAWKGWKFVYTVPLLNRLALKAAAIFFPYVPKLGPLKEWTRFRTPPKIAKKSLKDLVKEEGIKNG